MSKYTPEINRLLNSKSLSGDMTIIPDACGSAEFVRINKWGGQYPNLIDISEDEDGYAVMHADNTDGSVTFINVGECSVQTFADVPITISFEVKGSGTCRSFLYMPNTVDKQASTTSEGNINFGIDGAVDYTLSDEWRRCWTKYVCKDNSVHRLIPCRVTAGNEVYFRKPKIEYGDSMTEYNLSPEDYNVISEGGGCLSTDRITM